MIELMGKSEPVRAAIDCADAVLVLLDWSPAAITRFRDDLPGIVAGWKLQGLPPASAPKSRRASAFHVIEGGRPPA